MLEVKDHIRTDLLPFTEYVYGSTKTWKDKLSLLGISAEIGSSLMGGMVGVTVSGRYLDDRKSQVNSSSMTCKLCVQTEQDTLFLRKKGMSELIDMTLLKNLDSIEATHVVTSVLYGCNGFVTANYSYQNSFEKRELEGRIAASLNVLVASLDIEIGIEENKLSKDKRDHFEFAWKCDVNDGNAYLPTKFDEAVKKMSTLPQLIKGHDGQGRGVPVKVWLTPLKEVAKMLVNVNDIKLGAICQAIEDASLTKIMNYYQRLDDNILELQDLVKELTKDEALVHSSSLIKAQDALTNGEKARAILQGKFRTALVDIRSGGSTDLLDDWIEEFVQGDLGDSKVLATKLSFEMDLTNIRSTKSAQKEGIIVISRHDELPDNLNGKDYVLYTRFFDDPNAQEKSEMHKICFKKIMLSNKKRQEASVAMPNNLQFYWLDLDLCGKDGEVRIEERKFGKITDSDVYEHFNNDLQSNLIDMSSGVFWAEDKVSPYHLEFSSWCPLVQQGICQSRSLDWYCKNCKERIFFDVVDQARPGMETGIVFCKKCETAYIQAASIPFRCNSPCHGFLYKKYATEEHFKHQTLPLVSQIMQKYHAEPVNQDFLKFDLDNDLKLNQTEAQPMFRKFDILKKSIQTMEV